MGSIGHSFLVGYLSKEDKEQIAKEKAREQEEITSGIKKDKKRTPGAKKNPASIDSPVESSDESDHELDGDPISEEEEIPFSRKDMSMQVSTYRDSEVFSAVKKAKKTKDPVKVLVKELKNTEQSKLHSYVMKITNENTSFKLNSIKTMSKVHAFAARSEKLQEKCDTLQDENDNLKSLIEDYKRQV
jgi:hypothetical protein